MPQTTHALKQNEGRIGEFTDSTYWKDVVSAINGMTAATDGSDVLIFGTLVAQETDGTIKRLDAQADVLAGVLVLDDAYEVGTEVGSADTTGNKPGIRAKVTGSVARKGRMRVLLDETVAVGDAVRYYAKAVSGKRSGAFRTSDPTGTDTVLISAGARWVEGGTTTTGAVLEFDVLAMTFSADS